MALVNVAELNAAQLTHLDIHIRQLGEPITYAFKDGSASVSIRGKKRKLREEELVGDYDQTHLKFRVMADDIGKAPARYDTITAADGHQYVVMDYLAGDIGYGGEVLAYTMTVKG